MLIQATSYTSGYNPFLMVGRHLPTSSNSLVLCTAANRLLSCLNTALAALVSLFCLALLTNIYTISPGLGLLISIGIVCLQAIAWVKRERHRIQCEDIARQEYRFSLFTIEWLAVHTMFLLLLACLQIGTIGGLRVMIGLVIALSTASLLLPLAQGSLHLMQRR